MNAADADHATPLHLAVRQGSPVEPELVKTLIRHRADLEARDVKGNAPLHFLPYAQVRGVGPMAGLENELCRTALLCFGVAG